MAAGMGMVKSGPGETTNYHFAASSSQFRVHAFASGLISAIAHSPKFEIRGYVAAAQVLSKTFEAGTLSLSVNTSGLELIDDVRESDRRQIYRIMHNEVLESAIYPDITFQGRWVVSEKLGNDTYSVRVDGSLLLHGVKRSHAFEARVTLGPETCRVHGQFIVLQSEYGINIASIAGSTLKLQDMLKFSFFLIGRRDH